MEIGLLKFVGDILRSPTKLGALVVVTVLLVYAATKLLPMLLAHWK